MGGAAAPPKPMLDPGLAMRIRQFCILSLEVAK